MYVAGRYWYTFASVCIIALLIILFYENIANVIRSLKVTLDIVTLSIMQKSNTKFIYNIYITF